MSDVNSRHSEPMNAQNAILRLSSPRLVWVAWVVIPRTAQTPRGRYRRAAPGSHSVWVSGASARIGRPNAASMGHHDPPGTWIGPGGVAGGSRIGSWCSVFQRGSRFATVGITEKL